MYMLPSSMTMRHLIYIYIYIYTHTHTHTHTHVYGLLIKQEIKSKSALFWGLMHCRILKQHSSHTNVEA
jgi:hypothetical protein